MNRGLFSVCLLVTATLASASDGWKAMRFHHHELPNAFQLHAKVFSGGVPDGDAGFKQLRQMGVKTIISVDGAIPDLKAAKKHGLRYVHLPHGYDGISSSVARALAKAVTQLPGPIYVHCHHGRHRSPAAALVACIGAGFVEIEQRDMFLRTAGTSERYVGLYAAVNEVQKLEQDDLDRLDVPFPEMTAVPPLAKVMVDLELRFDKLASASRSNWKTSPSQGDIDPAHEALLLKEHFAEILRMNSSGEVSAGFLEILRDSLGTASRMETVLMNPRPFSPETVSALSTAITALKTDCRRCHASYRDRPQNMFPSKRGVHDQSPASAK